MKFECSAQEKCKFNTELREGDDIIAIWIHREMLPIILADLVSDVVSFKNCYLYHADCVLDEIKNLLEKEKE